MPKRFFWPNWVKLSLKGFDTASSVLTDILYQQKATLEEIKMVDMGLRGEIYQYDMDADVVVNQTKGLGLRPSV